MFVENNFSVWLRTGSNPVDINWIQSETGKIIKNYQFYMNACAILVYTALVKQWYRVGGSIFYSIHYIFQITNTPSQSFCVIPKRLLKTK